MSQDCLVRLSVTGGLELGLGDREVKEEKRRGRAFCPPLGRGTGVGWPGAGGGVLSRDLSDICVMQIVSKALTSVSPLKQYLFFSIWLHRVLVVAHGF